MEGAEAREYLVARQYPLRSRFGLGKTGVAGLVLGVGLGVHLVLTLEGLVLGWRRVTAWSLYAVALSTFHALEFVSTALYKWRDLSCDSYLLNHSPAYTAAVVASALEYAVECFFFAPPLWCVCFGCVVVLGGQVTRFLAMATCGEHFAHRIMTSRDEGHCLVTTGVYAYLRHPAYFGWFWWSLGTQILLANPICFLGYAYASWAFFADRIPYEEHTLLAFYPDQYPAYASRTFIGIPAISSPASLSSRPPPHQTHTD